MYIDVYNTYHVMAVTNGSFLFLGQWITGTRVQLTEENTAGVTMSLSLSLISEIQQRVLL